MKSRSIDWGIVEKEKQKLIAGEEVDESNIEPFVLEAWKRSIKLNVDPYMSRNMITETSATLTYPDLFFNPEEIEHDHGILKVISDYAIETGMTVEILDKNAKLLKVLARPHNSFLTILDQSETVLGASGACIALRENRPIQIFGPEHFNFNISNSDASSVPIHGPDGEVVGVLTIAGRLVRQQLDTLVLAIALANIIEMYFLTYTFDQHMDMYDQAFEMMIKKFKAPDMNNHSNRLRSIKEISEFQTVMRKNKVMNSAFLSSGFTMYKMITGLGLFELNDKDIKKHLNKKSTTGIKGYTFNDIIGESPGIQKSKELAKKVAMSSAPVLIHGESGTGKELFAQSIHNASSRSDGPFVSINCGAIPAELAESEFFGYEAGSFTGGLKEGKEGKLVAASGGTLFLDEVESMPLNLQVKILRALSSGSITKIGGVTEIPIDLRVVSATKKDLAEECKAGRFREDLMFRINVFTLELPALRKRDKDIPILINYFLKSFAEERSIDNIKIDPQAMAALKSYSWPGNVRELQNAVERAVILMNGDNLITLENLPAAIIESYYAKEILEEMPNSNSTKGGVLENTEERLVREVLKQEKGNVTQTAKRLGISRSKIYRKYKYIIDELTKKV
jgi:transcriptional regulator with PAS, ATPase and Fis domain